jgi:hypothetical protein
MQNSTAQLLLNEAKARNRRSNYGKHPISAITDVDTYIRNNAHYINVQKNINALTQSYLEMKQVLSQLINHQQQLNMYLAKELQLINTMPIYTYNIIDKAPFKAFLNTINALIAECNALINTIQTSTIDDTTLYPRQLLISEVSSSANAVVTKSWLNTYIASQPTLPTINKPNSVLVCNAQGEIQWS